MFQTCEQKLVGLHGTVDPFQSSEMFVLITQKHGNVTSIMVFHCFWPVFTKVESHQCVSAIKTAIQIL